MTKYQNEFYSLSIEDESYEREAREIMNACFAEYKNTKYHNTAMLVTGAFVADPMVAHNLDQISHFFLFKNASLSLSKEEIKSLLSQMVRGKFLRSRKIGDTLHWEVNFK